VHDKNVTHDSPLTGINTLENNNHNLHNDQQAEARMAMNAVIHIGPHKTGSTTIQAVSLEYYTQLVKDNYEVPFAHNKQKYERHGRKRHSFVANHGSFAACFFPENHSYTSEKGHEKCIPKTLTAGLEIANLTKSILISAERFDTPGIDVQALSDYLQPWQSVTIVIYYRRFYDWIISYNNQLTKNFKHKS